MPPKPDAPDSILDAPEGGDGRSPGKKDNSVAGDELKLLIERIERLEEEKKGNADDIKDVYAEGKAKGYDTKTMRIIIRLRKMEAADRQEMEALLETYKAVFGL